MDGVDNKRSRLPGPTPLKTKAAVAEDNNHEPKRMKMASSTSNLTKTRSMMNIDKVAGGGGVGKFSNANAIKKPLPSSMTTGRATTAFGGGAVRGAPQMRTAMRDRTNAASISEASKKTGLAAQKSNSSSTIVGGAKKRPAWDLKGRLEDMELRFASTSERLHSLESQNRDLENNVHVKEEVVSQRSEELSAAQTRLASIETESSQLRRERDDLSFTNTKLMRQLSDAQSDVEVKRVEIQGLRESVARLTSSAVTVEAERDILRAKMADADRLVEQLQSEQQADRSTIQAMVEQEQKYETERRKLHNMVQELKGNIRVFCRIRPFLSADFQTQSGRDRTALVRSRSNLSQTKEESSGASEPSPSMNHIQVADDKSISLVKDEEGGKSDGGQRYEFEFDKIFAPTTCQADVFAELSQLVQSAIDGYHVCVFAYGQTGSGKTFTMEGGSASPRQPVSCSEDEDMGEDPAEVEERDAGMIPRTLRLIFDQAKRLGSKGWNFDLNASFIEIYNEEFRDLLATEKGLKYELKMTKDSERDGCVTVSNLRTERVTSEGQITSLMKRARRARTVAATQCNERSSRSHSVFRLHIEGKNSATTEHTVGVLNLVDLAGSERLKESMSEGLRLTETKNINKSLANLGNVIMALAQKDSHVPYRNSKLTHLLQGSLGGNSKTLMFVNISPKHACFNETLNSLRFAAKVNQCQIGTATKRVK